MGDLPTSSPGCCSSCGTEITTQVPGPAGTAGAAGANGTDGINAFTVLIDNFQIPNVDSFDTAKVQDPTSFFVGQVVALEGAGINSNNATLTGYFVVFGFPAAQQINLLNAASLSDLNAAPGSIIMTGAELSPAGQRGPQGTAGGITNLNGASPTTTKGDIMVDNGANSPAASVVRLAAGTNKFVIHADSAQPTGIRYGAVDLTGAATSISGALPIGNGGTGQTVRATAFDGLAPVSAVAGDLMYHNGTNWVRLPKGTALQVLRMNGGATAPEWATGAAGVLQMVSTSSNILTTINTAIPYDDTIPQITEGTQLFTLTVTPVSASSRLVIEALMSFTTSVDNTVICALFSGGANALAAFSKKGSEDDATEMMLNHEIAPGSVTPITFTLRLGRDTGGSLYINGLLGARKLGGVQTAWFRVTEFA